MILLYLSNEKKTKDYFDIKIEYAIKNPNFS